MCTDARLLFGGLALLLAACSSTEDRASSSPTDAGALADVVTKSDADGAIDAAADSAPAPACKEGRRRCVGLDLEVCDGGGWVLLQSCLPGEWCDVAVGICRAVDAGPDSAAGDAG